MTHSMTEAFHRQQSDDPSDVLQWHRAGGGFIHEAVQKGMGHVSEEAMPVRLHDLPEANCRIFWAQTAFMWSQGPRRNKKKQDRAD